MQRSKFHAVAIATAVGTFTGQSLAQSGTNLLEEIVVTATKRGESNLMDTPISITALQGQMFEEIGASSMAEVLRLAPGVSLMDDGQGQSRIQIRGVANFAGEAMVGYYIDDMAYSNGIGSPDVGTFDIRRTEVLKGPQGTLYGASALGGVVRIITNDADPSAGVNARFDGSYGNIESGGQDYEMNASINLPIAEDIFALRLTGTMRRERHQCLPYQEHLARH